MGSEQSEVKLFTKVANTISGLLSSVDRQYLDRSQKQILNELKRLLVDARVSLRDYELADTRVEMLQHAAEAGQYLQDLHKHVLAASGFGVFSAVDVAHVSADLDVIMQRVKEN